MDILISRLSSIGTGGLEGSFFEGVAYRSLGDVMAFLPQGLVRFLVSPLPWKTSLAHWHEALGSVLRYALLPFAAIGMVVIWRRERWAFLPMLVMLLLGAALYAIAFRGGGPRHMTQFYPYFLVSRRGRPASLSELAAAAGARVRRLHRRRARLLRLPPRLTRSPHGQNRDPSSHHRRRRRRP